MSEMVARVAGAIHGVANVWRRTNKLHSNGAIYEIGYTPDNGAAPVVVEAFSDYTEAMAAQIRLQAVMQARAALEAMREPTTDMVRVGTGAATMLGAWRLMIAAALGEEAASRPIVDVWRPLPDLVHDGANRISQRTEMGDPQFKKIARLAPGSEV
jgi:hypothetical protein